MPINTYAYKHNLPQNTLTCFVTAASYYLLCAYLRNKAKYLYLIICALFIVAAIFANGGTALYPLSLFFLLWLVFRQPKFIKVMMLSIALLVLVALLTSLILLYKPAYHAMSMYFHTQLWASIAEHRVGHFSGLKRLNVLGLLFNNLFPVAILSLILYYLFTRKTPYSFIPNLLAALKDKWFIFFILAGFIASLPVMLVSRQQEHYLLQAYPLFVIAFAQLLNPIAKRIVSGIAGKYSRYLIWLTVSLSLFFIAIFLLIINFGRLGAYKDLLRDTMVIGKIVPKGSIVYLAPSLADDVKTHSIMYRYNQISFAEKPCCKYQLWPKVTPVRKISGYQKLSLPLKEFTLYQSIKDHSFTH